MLYPAESGVTFRRVLPIILRDENKDDIDFDINDLRIKEHLVNVNRINKCLSLHFVSAEIPLYDYREFMQDFAKYTGMDKYCRIYNNSDFRQGGRFYRHWTQEIKSRFRKYITIDGQPTVEIDYSCLHLSMLYGLENMKAPEGDLYDVVGIDCKYRPIVKKAVNIAINAETETSALRAIQQEYPEFIQEYGCTPPPPKVILQAVKDTHPLVSKYLCSNYGVHLQNIDSSIAEKILLSFAKDNICCLCIHDSFIVSKEYLYRLQQVMSDYFQEYFNFTPRISSK